MQETSFRCSRVCKVLGNPVAFQILEAIAKEPCAPSELAKKVRRSMPAVSHQLRSLRMADLVRFTSKGQYVLYRLKYQKEVLEIIDGLKGLIHLSSQHKTQDTEE